MKICVYGAGAVGGCLAARLSAAGHDVSAVARGAHLAAIRERGIVLEAGDERIVRRIPASDRPADFGPQDFVISTLKANALAALAADGAALLGPDTAVVFAQNGIPWWYGQGLDSAIPARRHPPVLAFLDPGGALAGAIASKRIMAGVIYSANTVIAPGVISNGSPRQNRLLLGEPDDRESPRLFALRKAFEESGIGAPPVTDIRREIWQKLLSNIITGLTVLVDEPTSDMLADPALGEFARRVLAEGVAIGGAHGLVLEPLMPNVPAGKKSALLQDYELGRPMEIDAQYQAPLAFAHAAGLAAPLLQAATALIAHRAAAKGLYRR